MGMTFVTGKNASGATKNMMAGENPSGHLAAATVQVDEDGNRVGTVTNPLHNVANFEQSIEDAFGRLRVSEAHTLFDSKQIFDNSPLFWDEELTSGAGISTSWSKDLAGTTITSTLSTAGNFIRRTFESFNYQPGKSQLVMMTGTIDLSGGGTGVQRRIGQYNTENGLYFEDLEGTMQVVIRSKVSGSVVNTKVAQASWNLDVMDGSGTSGLTIDWTKSHIFVIDYEWLSVGRVRFGLVYGGKIIYVHAFENANVNIGAYMSTPNLPLTYEMVTTASSPASTMIALCSTVISEGEHIDLGITGYVSTGGAHVDANSANTLYAIVGVRLKAAHIGEVIKMTKITVLSETNAAYEWVLMLNPTVAGTFTYNDEVNMGVQCAKGATANTVTGGHPLDGGFGSLKSDVQEPLDAARYLGAAIDGTVDEIVLCVRPLSANSDIQGSLSYKEIS